VKIMEKTFDDECECSGLVPGAVVGMNDRDEIQRCDLCNRYESDDEAAHAVARAVNGTAEMRRNASEPGSSAYWVVVAPLSARAVEMRLSE
jgi:hypothetical protein